MEPNLNLSIHDFSFYDESLTADSDLALPFQTGFANDLFDLPPPEATAPDVLDGNMLGLSVDGFGLGSLGMGHFNESEAQAVGLDLGSLGQTESGATSTPDANGATLEWYEGPTGLQQRRVKKCDRCLQKISLGPGSTMQAYHNHQASEKCNKKWKLRASATPSGSSTTNSSPSVWSRSVTLSPAGLPSIIMPEASAVSPAAPSPQSSSTPQSTLCPGAKMQFESSVYSTYPWHLHDYYQLPYTILSIATDRRTLCIRSINCTSVTVASMDICAACSGLDGHKELLALKNRAISQPAAGTNFRFMNYKQLVQQLKEKNGVINDFKIKACAQVWFSWK